MTLKITRNSYLLLFCFLLLLFYSSLFTGSKKDRNLFSTNYKRNGFCHRFPTDRECLDIDKQFLWGSGLMISPVLDEGATEKSIYFPHGAWYDYYTVRYQMFDVE